VAYVVADGVLSAGRLRGELAQQLPDYMVPGAFVSVDALPLTANGKVDRLALPAMDDERPGTAGEYTAPRSETEALISRLWGEVLGLRQVGVLDNFFELGGHSLLATRLMSRVREALGIDLPLRALFEAPTVAGLSRHVGALQWALAGRVEETANMTELEL
jgi:acyl carrier protein